MRILVTGGAGFLGSHLCDQLIAEGHDVICLDNLFTGSKVNINHLLHLNKFEFVRHDVIFPYSAEVDVIYNLACPASPVHYQSDPIKTIKTSMLGAMHMLELAQRVHAKILQASTSEVYGDPLEHPQKECYWGNVNPVGIRSCYDEGKRIAETLFFEYHAKGVRCKLARIFNTYGPRMNNEDGRVVSNFIVSALKNEPITIYGTGLQTRSFCYVTDLIDALIMLQDTEDSFLGPMNLGNDGEFTILELAEKVKELTNSKSEIICRRFQLPKDDPKQRKPDLSLAKSKLEWTPKVKLEDGLKKTIAYFHSALLF